MKTSPNRALIVGGGHNGLVCACYLARAGLEVTVFERRGILGGAAVTETFHPGFRNSTASYTVSLLHPKVIEELNLAAHGLRILPRPVNNFVPTADGDGFVSHRDPERTRAGLRRFSERDAKALPGWNAALDRIVPVLKDIVLETPPRLEGFAFSDIGKMLRLSGHFRRLDADDRRLLLRLFGSSAGEILDDTFESDVIKALLGFDAIVGHYASPYTPGSAYVMLHHVFGEVNGATGAWGHAVGGMGAISDAITAEATALGVRLETEAAVSEVLVSNGRVRGVRLESGDVFESDLVACGLNPKRLFLDLLDPEVVAEPVQRHFEQYKCKSGTFRMNVALRDLPRFTGQRDPQDLTGGIIMAPSLDWMDRAYTSARENGFSTAPIVEMLIPSLVDDSLARPGQHVASLFCQQFDPDLGARWIGYRETAVDVILDTVEQFAPGFRKLIIATQAHSPFDLEQKFGLVGGDIFHGRLSLDQLFSARPMLGMGQYRTDIEGLWLCGSGAHPGGGVSGLPGHNAAREILRRH